jgi:hypothetical protein
VVTAGQKGKEYGFMNSARLEKSLRLLRNVNDARLLKNSELIRIQEARLRQHDYDSRDKINPRQMNIYDVIDP